MPTCWKFSLISTWLSQNDPMLPFICMFISESSNSKNSTMFFEGNIFNQNSNRKTHRFYFFRGYLHSSVFGTGFYCMYINALYCRTANLNIGSSEGCQNSSSSMPIKIHSFLLLWVSPEKELKVSRMKKWGGTEEG